MKYLLFIGDGMADDPVPALDGKTPLQYARTPMMDGLASAGVIGTALTVPEGMAPGSDAAILSIFGYDPRSCLSGRAALEAAAVGIELPPGDIAYRCNMVTVEDGDIPFDDKKIVSHSAGAIGSEDSEEILNGLLESPAFKEAAGRAGLTIHAGSSYRHIAVQKAPVAGGALLTPPHDHLGERVGDHLPRGGSNAGVLEGLMRLAHGIMDCHPLNTKRRKEGELPANGIWLWAGGPSAELPKFANTFGRTGGVISAVPLCQGIGVLIGLEKIYVEGATGQLHTNYEGKAAAALDVLQRHDFVAIHIEAPDECTHMGDTEGKVQAIEWIDSRALAPLVGRLRETGGDFRMLLISDHRTLTATRGHDGGPVPYVIYDSRADRGTGAAFCEESAARGEHIAEGTQLMGMLFEMGPHIAGAGR